MENGEWGWVGFGWSSKKVRCLLAWNVLKAINLVMLCLLEVTSIISSSKSLQPTFVIHVTILIAKTKLSLSWQERKHSMHVPVIAAYPLCNPAGPMVNRKVVSFVWVMTCARNGVQLSQARLNPWQLSTGDLCRFRGSALPGIIGDTASHHAKKQLYNVFCPASIYSQSQKTIFWFQIPSTGSGYEYTEWLPCQRTVWVYIMAESSLSQSTDCPDDVLNSTITRHWEITLVAWKQNPR